MSQFNELRDSGDDLTTGALTSGDRSAWQELFAGYNAFYGRVMPDEFFDRSWVEFSAAQRIAR